MVLLKNLIYYITEIVKSQVFFQKKQKNKREGKGSEIFGVRGRGIAGICGIDAGSARVNKRRECTRAA